MEKDFDTYTCNHCNYTIIVTEDKMFYDVFGDRMITCPYCGKDINLSNLDW